MPYYYSVMLAHFSLRFWQQELGKKLTSTSSRFQKKFYWAFTKLRYSNASPQYSFTTTTSTQDGVLAKIPCKWIAAFPLWTDRVSLTQPLWMLYSQYINQYPLSSRSPLQDWDAHRICNSWMILTELSSMPCFRKKQLASIVCKLIPTVRLFEISQPELKARPLPFAEVDNNKFHHVKSSWNLLSEQWTHFRIKVSNEHRVTHYYTLFYRHECWCKAWAINHEHHQTITMRHINQSLSMIHYSRGEPKPAAEETEAQQDSMNKMHWLVELHEFVMERKTDIPT